MRKSSDTTLLDNSGLKIQKVYGDLNDKEFMDTCMIGINTVLHIAGIQKTYNVIESAVKNSVKRAIVVHTTGIYSKFKSASEDYKNIELRTKILLLDNASPIDMTILRPTMIYGNLQDLNMSKFIKMVDSLRLFPVINHGDSLIQPINARDLGKAYYQVLMASNLRCKEYILSGEKPIKMVDAFKLISENLGKKTNFINVPLDIGVCMARTLKFFTWGKVDYVEKVQRMGENRSFPYDDAARDFDYKPMSFDEGIKIEVQQYLNRYIERENAK